MTRWRPDRRRSVKLTQSVGAGVVESQARAHQVSDRGMFVLQVVVGDPGLAKLVEGLELLVRHDVPPGGEVLYRQYGGELDVKGTENSVIDWYR